MGRLRQLRLAHILVFITFFVIGLVINLIQFPLYLTLPRRTFHQLNYYLVAAIYGYLVCLADWWGESSFTLYCSDKFHENLLQKCFKERSLVVVNHHTELDWLYCWQLADRGGLVGSCRALVKNSLQYVPVIGWSSFMSGDVFISRSWENDKQHMKAKVECIELQPIPTWLFVFPEGTRFNQKKHKASQEFAESRGLPILQHHLIPRTKGFSLTAGCMEGSLLDLTFVQGPNTAPPTLNSLLMARGVDTRVFIRQIPLTTVPKGEKESGEWLMNLFKEKDEIKSAFQAGDWDRLKTLGDFTERVSPKRTWSLVWSGLSQILVLSPLAVLLIKGGLMTWCVSVLVLVLAWLALDMFVSISKIKKEA